VDFFGMKTWQSFQKNADVTWCQSGVNLVSISRQKSAVTSTRALYLPARTRTMRITEREYHTDKDIRRDETYAKCVNRASKSARGKPQLCICVLLHLARGGQRSLCGRENQRTICDMIQQGGWRCLDVFYLLPKSQREDHWFCVCTMTVQVSPKPIALFSKSAVNLLSIWRC